MTMAMISKMVKNVRDHSVWQKLTKPKVSSIELSIIPGVYVFNGFFLIMRTMLSATNMPWNEAGRPNFGQ
jgi:hypothetical protein